MYKKNIYLAVLSSVFISSISSAQTEVTGKLTLESASYTDNEYVKESYAYNPSNAWVGKASEHGTDSFKEEVNARIYFDGNFENGDAYHAELQAFNDGEGDSFDMGGNESYTQRDALREAYVDTSYKDWAIRAGKQQVVWGTADGMKLLDNINPTDFSEMAQNQMEDSRIPVWMLNAEKPLEKGNIQFIISQPKENIFAGLNRSINTSTRTNTNSNANLSTSVDVAAIGTNKGHPFTLLGVDSITGTNNGFLNIVPDLGTVANLFGQAFAPAPSSGKRIDGLAPQNHSAMNFFTVGAFNTSAKLGAGTGSSTSYYNGQYKAVLASGSHNYSKTGVTYTGDGFEDLTFGDTGFWLWDGSAMVDETDATAGQGYSGQGALQGFANMHPESNLLNTDSAINSVFEYMDRTAFSTFDAFVNAGSRYTYKMPSGSDVDLSTRFSDTTEDGMNYSLNYSYAYDKNPIINLRWEDSSGNLLYTCKNSQQTASGTNYYLKLDNESGCSGNSVVGGDAGSYATLVFEQEVKRIHNIGGSFDMTMETDTLGPVVIRGEAVYQKDTYTPVMDRGKMSIGDLTGALTMRKGDRFKYVIGADITALTNMMISAQFIQDRNLDYIDSNVDHDGSTTCSTTNCGVYTTDYATMHMSNGFNKAAKNKNFYSLYLSKPFGESGQHRWNNITIFEETGGYWNRLDAEYTLDDNTILTGEINSYFGDADTQFGQLKTSSNVQVGLKYSF